VQRIRFYTNAALEIHTADARILCDPWFTPGAFDGSWFHYPPLRTRPEDCAGYTHLYVSHIHPDHCDVATLARLPDKTVPVVILRSAQPFLRGKIERAGFRTVIELDDGESRALTARTTVTMLRAFTASSLVPDARVPNVIDSSLLVDDGDHRLLNVNDNTPTPEACRAIRARFGTIDVALMPYSGVGPYPSCYDNLRDDEKDAAASRKSEAFLARMLDNVAALGARHVVPAAGMMILGGRAWQKNRWLGVAEPEQALARLAAQGVSACLLAEGDELDVRTLAVQRAGGPPPPAREAVARSLANVRYWWEDAFDVPPAQRIDPLPLLTTARQRLWTYQQRFEFADATRIVLHVTDAPLADDYFVFALDRPAPVERVPLASFDADAPFLRVSLPYALLIAILTRHCHWNNAYHGCLVDWFRHPDVYRPEVQTLLSYLHL